MARWVEVAMVAALCAALGFFMSACSGCGGPARTKVTREAAMKGEQHMVDRRGEPRAPELDGAIAWLNASEPVRLRELRGHVVLLDFWTYCCINCMHVLPVLGELEDALAGKPLAVIGVHSAKFTGERDPQRIRDAIERYGVRHPVAVDSEFAIWQRYAVNAWPTLVVIRPSGTIAAVIPGEPEVAALKAIIQDVMNDAAARGELAATPKALLTEARRGQSALAFPGKVSAFADGRLLISDSGHHRLLVTDAQGEVLETIGGGLRGLRDGTFAEASFNDPQGAAIARDGTHAFVADARNHVVRRIDFRARRVETIAGTGRLGRLPLTAAWESARDVELRSPWDVALTANGARLIVALAGSHQIGEIDLGAGKVRRLAGTGRESIVDGSAATSAFAQPSGLALAGDRLYVADSETSAVREVDIRNGETRTLVGTGLFDFGDTTGPRAKSRFQHPLHVVALENKLIVVDTYNGKLKEIDLVSDLVRNFYRGTGNLELKEPGGAALVGGALVVADTSHHRLLRVGRDGRSATEIAITGAPRPLVGAVASVDRHAGASGSSKDFKLSGPDPNNGGSGGFARAGGVGNAGTLELVLGPHGADVALELVLEAPADHELSAGSPIDIALRGAGSNGYTVASLGTSARGGRTNTFPIKLARKTLAPSTSYLLDVDAVVCDAKNKSYCQPVHNRFAVNLMERGAGVGDAAPSTLRVPLTRTAQ